MEEKGVVKIDILQIDAKITSHFEEEVGKLTMYKLKVEELKHMTSMICDDEVVKGFGTVTIVDKIELEIKMYETMIEEIESNKDYTFYLYETLPILEKYKKILQTKNGIKDSSLKKIKI